MIQGYRESSERKVSIVVNRSEQEAVDEAGAINLALSALEKGRKTCDRGADCCLSVAARDSSKSADTPTHTFEIECTDEGCDTQGVKAAESNLTCLVHEISGS